MNVNLNNGKVFCTKCGTENKAGYRFCVKCGEKLMTPVPKPQPEDVQEFPQPKPVKVEPKPAPQTFSAFEQATPVEEQVPQAFNAFEQASPETQQLEVDAFKPVEPVKAEGFASVGQAAFEEEPSRQDTGFARSGFMGTTTPTVAAGAFATAVDAVKNDKKIDISDAETVMSLLEQGESSALAKGLPEWDIVPPQVVVRRKHRV